MGIRIVSTSPTAFLEHEARALLTRLQRVKPFALSETMVPAANLSPTAQRAIEQYLAQGRERLRQQGQQFIDSLQYAQAPVDAQRRFALLRLRFNAVLAQFDLFADALSQRGERDHGVWMAGLDVLANDALALPSYYESPPLVCYLDRGIGAAIRRARTRLPGGGANPAAIIRVPRERMVGSGIASSLVHEVGHQAVALLGLLESLRPALRQRAASDVTDDSAWHYWERWISEILADFWAVARLAIAAPLGLIGVLSLPRAFVFRISTDDPHPAPWIRVLLACAIGAALYPGAQWARLAQLWKSLYPIDGLARAQRGLLTRLALGLDAFVHMLLNHRAPALRGATLAEVTRAADLQDAALRSLWARWQAQPSAMFDAPPCLACAVIGQARVDGELTPGAESRSMARLLTHWALRANLGTVPVHAPIRFTHPYQLND
jgi:hypothetical protein